MFVHAACWVLRLLVCGLPLIPSTGVAQESADNAPPLLEPESSELWYGELDADVRVFRFAITLTQLASTPTQEKEWRGELLSLDEGNRRFPLTKLLRDDQSLRFELRGTGAIYSATLDPASGEFNGTWKQAGELPLRFSPVRELPKPAIKTIWKGQIDAVVQKIDIAFREYEDGRVFFESVSQKAGGFVVKLTSEKDSWTFEIPALKSRYEAKLNATGDQLEGLWKQSLLPLKLTMTKAPLEEAPPEKPNRPQTPHPPFPYDVEKVAIENGEAEGVWLAGTLTLPKGASHVPAVLLISGSGPQDRDELLFEHRPFAVLADYLTRQGYAVLRCDDRGVGESTGDFSTATSVDFASDVRAMLRFLRKDPRIDSRLLGLCGHSEGGLIAPMVAAEDHDIGFLILLAGTGVNGREILQSQSRLILEASGIDPVTLEKQSKMQKAMIDLALQSGEHSNEEFLESARQAMDLVLGDQGSESDRTQWEAGALQLRTPWFQFFLAYEPKSALEKVTCPVLILNGAKDLQVDPQLNVPAIEGALAKGGNRRFTSIILDDLNHLFQRCKTGSVGEYAEIEETFNPAALEAIGDWLKKQCSPKD